MTNTYVRWQDINRCQRCQATWFGTTPRGPVVFERGRSLPTKIRRNVDEENSLRVAACGRRDRGQLLAVLEQFWDLRRRPARGRPGFRDPPGRFRAMPRDRSASAGGSRGFRPPEESFALSASTSTGNNALLSSCGGITPQHVRALRHVLSRAGDLVPRPAFYVLTNNQLA